MRRCCFVHRTESIYIARHTPLPTASRITVIMRPGVKTVIKRCLHQIFMKSSLIPTSVKIYFLYFKKSGFFKLETLGQFLCRIFRTISIMIIVRGWIRFCCFLVLVKYKMLYQLFVNKQSFISFFNNFFQCCFGCFFQSLFFLINSFLYKTCYISKYYILI